MPFTHNLNKQQNPQQELCLEINTSHHIHPENHSALNNIADDNLYLEPITPNKQEKKDHNDQDEFHSASSSLSGSPIIFTNANEQLQNLLVEEDKFEEAVGGVIESVESNPSIYASHTPATFHKYLSSILSNYRSTAVRKVISRTLYLDSFTYASHQDIILNINNASGIILFNKFIAELNALRKIVNNMSSLTGRDLSISSVITTAESQQIQSLGDDALRVARTIESLKDSCRILNLHSLQKYLLTLVQICEYAIKQKVTPAQVILLFCDTQESS